MKSISWPHISATCPANVDRVARSRRNVSLHHDPLAVAPWTVVERSADLPDVLDYLVDESQDVAAHFSQLATARGDLTRPIGEGARQPSSLTARNENMVGLSRERAVDQARVAAIRRRVAWGERLRGIT